MNKFKLMGERISEIMGELQEETSFLMLRLGASGGHLMEPEEETNMEQANQREQKRNQSHSNIIFLVVSSLR